MTPKSRAEIDDALAQWNYMKTLPEEWHGFVLRHDRSIHDEIYDLFTYSNPKLHRMVSIYFHDETKEYKLRERVGTLEFCNIECIDRKLEGFERLLQENLEKILLGMIHFRPETVCSMLETKKVTTWDYSKFLPDTLEGFELFIRPEQPLRITNGSYVVFDYENFDKNCNMAIYYNIYRDDFFCEAHINGYSKIYYEFDSKEMEDLEEKVQIHLAACLHDIIENAAMKRDDD